MGGRNRRPTLFKAPWLPSRGAVLAAWRAEEQRWRPQAPATQRGYDKAWTELRRRHIGFEPNCRHCAVRGIDRRATIVDHIVAIRVAPERRLDPTNLQSLCYSCHQRKTRRERLTNTFSGGG